MRTKILSLCAGILTTTSVLAGCAGEPVLNSEHGQLSAPGDEHSDQGAHSPGEEAASRLPGMPPNEDPGNIYASTTRADQLSEPMRAARELVYVPNSRDDTVSVIDPKTFEVINTFPAGDEPQHVVPSYDMRTLYAAADKVPGGSLTPIDPKTGEPGDPIPVQDPYNLYFTPDGKSAVVVAEAYKRLDFYDPKTWQKQGSLPVPECGGVNHMDFTADGKRALIACEFANRMITLDVANRRVIKQFDLPVTAGGKPQDTRLSPDGKTFYVADMVAGGIYRFSGDAMQYRDFIPTGSGAHGIYFSRDAKRMFVTNRGEGSVSVLAANSREEIDKWQIPGSASPDMGALSTDGSQLWLTGRYDSEVYVLDTATGELIERIPVGNGPHGLTYVPQPGRYSLGHTSSIR
ncbi:YncE family protein [Salinifilum aidingensis]